MSSWLMWYVCSSRVSSTWRSSTLWQVSSGNVGTAFGLGPRSPTISSSGPMYSVFFAQIS